MKTDLYYYNNRVYRIPEFKKHLLDSTIIHWPELQRFNKDLILIWNIKIKRYIIYKLVNNMPEKWRQYNGTYVIVLICHGPKHCYRPYGNWVLLELKRRDLSFGGTRTIKEKTSIELNPQDKENIRKLSEIFYEAYKDYDKIGKTSVLVTPVKEKQHKNLKRKKVVLVSMKTGKVLYDGRNSPKKNS